MFFQCTIVRTNTVLDTSSPIINKRWGPNFNHGELLPRYRYRYVIHKIRMIHSSQSIPFGRRFSCLTSLFGSHKDFISAKTKLIITMTMSSEEIQSKFFDYVDQRQDLYIKRLGEAVG